jgi:hypothetical protein
MIPVDHPDNAAWRALQFFIYSAIILNFTATFLCLMAIKMCTDLPHYAQQMAVLQGKSWPNRAARGETLKRELLTDHWRLLKAFGMSSRYRFIDALFFFIVIFGCLYAFIAVVIWICLTVPPAVSGATMVTVLPAAVSIVCGVFVSKERWQ